MAAPSSPPSAPTFALAQFARTMEPIEGVRRARRRRQTRWGRDAASNYSLGRQLEDRQLLALGGRCGYFPADIVRRWLAEDTPAIGDNLESLRSDVRAKLPPLSRIEQLLPSHDVSDDPEGERVAFAATLQAREFYVRSAGLMPGLLFATDAEWDRFMSDITEAVEVESVNFLPATGNWSLWRGDLDEVFDWITDCGRLLNWLSEASPAFVDPWGIDVDAEYFGRSAGAYWIPPDELRTSYLLSVAADDIETLFPGALTNDATQTLLVSSLIEYSLLPGQAAGRRRDVGSRDRRPPHVGSVSAAELGTLVMSSSMQTSWGTMLWRVAPLDERSFRRASELVDRAERVVEALLSQLPPRALRGYFF